MTALKLCRMVWSGVEEEIKAIRVITHPLFLELVVVVGGGVGRQVVPLQHCHVASPAVSVHGAGFSHTRLATIAYSYIQYNSYIQSAWQRRQGTV